MSQHLPVPRLNGFAVVRADGARRLYAVDPTPLQEVDRWLEPYRRFWTAHLDVPGTDRTGGTYLGKPGAGLTG